MDKRTKRELARKRLIIHSVLCVVLPPVGMLLVWRNRYPRRMKLLMTLGATIVLTAMFSIGLRMRPIEEIEPTPVSAAYEAQEQTVQPADTPVDMQTAAPAQDEGIVAPANPNG